MNSTNNVNTHSRKGSNVSFSLQPKKGLRGKGVSTNKRNSTIISTASNKAAMIGSNLSSISSGSADSVEQNKKPRIRYQLQNQNVCLADLKKIPVTTTHMELTECTFVDGFPDQFFKTFKDLSVLDLSSSRFLQTQTATWMDGLQNVKILRMRKWNATQFTQANIRCLENLHTLDLRETNVSDLEMGYIATLRNLHELDVSMTPITRVGFYQLRNTPSLKIVRVEESGEECITRLLHAMNDMQKLTQIKKLSFAGSDVTIDHFKLLQNLSSLITLDLKGANLEQVGELTATQLPFRLDILVHIPKLKTLDVTGTSIIGKDVARFQAWKKEPIDIRYDRVSLIDGCQEKMGMRLSEYLDPQALKTLVIVSKDIHASMKGYLNYGDLEKVTMATAQAGNTTILDFLSVGDTAKLGLAAKNIQQLANSRIGQRFITVQDIEKVAKLNPNLRVVCFQHCTFKREEPKVQSSITVVDLIWQQVSPSLETYELNKSAIVDFFDISDLARLQGTVSNFTDMRDEILKRMISKNGLRKTACQDVFLPTTVQPKKFAQTILNPGRVEYTFINCVVPFKTAKSFTQFQNVSELQLKDCTGLNVQAVKKMPNLHHLSIEGATRDDLTTLRDAFRTQKIVANVGKQTNDIVPCNKAKLKTLSLANSKQLTSGDLFFIQDIRSLKSLDLSNCPGIKTTVALTELPELETLYIRGTGISAADLQKSFLGRRGVLEIDADDVVDQELQKIVPKRPSPSSAKPQINGVHVKKPQVVKMPFSVQPDPVDAITLAKKPVNGVVDEITQGMNGLTINGTTKTNDPEKLAFERMHTRKSPFDRDEPEDDVSVASAQPSTLGVEPKEQKAEVDGLTKTLQRVSLDDSKRSAAKSNV